MDRYKTLIIILLTITLHFSSAIVQQRSVFSAPKTNSSSKDDKRKAKTTPAVLTDIDNDGVYDVDDVCPDMPGPLKTKGCPDSDGDGVADFEDDCPNQAGLARFAGCPDTDGDGVPDNRDVCPNEAGLPNNSGCPVIEHKIVQPLVSETVDTIPFIDNTPFKGEETNLHSPNWNTYHDDVVKQNLYENVNDHDEIERVKRVTIPTPAIKEEEKPETHVRLTPKVTVLNSVLKIDSKDLLRLSSILQNINFEFGRILFTSTSYQSLEQLADLLRRHPTWKIVLHCYSFEADNNFRNLQLAANRGANVRQFLARKNIDMSRIEYKAYGSHESGFVSASNSLINMDIQ